MSILTSIDPGNDTGWARWIGGMLVACGVGEPPLSDSALVVIEKPQVYRATRSKGDPNDLIELAIMVGQYRERAILRGAREVLMPTPAEWKGQVPKDTHAKRIIAALSPEMLWVATSGENAHLPASKRHNMIDAIGLGLWTLGRLGRGGV